MNSGAVGDIANIIDYRGSTPPKSPDGIKLLTAKVIKDGHIDESRLEYISEETYAWWMRRGFPQQGDILLTTEAPLGEVALLRTAEPIALAQRVILLRGHSSLVDQQYLFAALRSPLMQDRLRQRATGTTVLGIKQRELRQVQVPLPPLTIQRKIAAILSPYDDLIENNNRRVRLLEELAQRIDREWFVHFRYPGHENVPMTNSELGAIPRGWTVVPLGEVSSVDGGSTTTKASFVARGYTAYSASGPDGFLPDYQVDGPGVVVSAVGARCGRTWYASGKWSSIANTLRIQAMSGRSTAEWLYFVTLDPDDWNRRGSAQPFIAISDVRARPIVAPRLELMLTFTDLVLPLLRLVDTLRASGANLVETRDLLLPMLISGELNVTDLDIVVPEAAA